MYGNQKITINPLCQSHNFDQEDSCGGDSRSMLFAKGSPVGKNKYDQISSIRESIFFRMIPSSNNIDKKDEPKIIDPDDHTNCQHDHLGAPVKN